MCYTVPIHLQYIELRWTDNRKVEICRNKVEYASHEYEWLLFTNMTDKRNYMILY